MKEKALGPLKIESKFGTLLKKEVVVRAGFPFLFFERVVTWVHFINVLIYIPW